MRQSGDHPGPLDEILLWKTRLDKLHSIDSQLESAVAVDILRNLEEANSQYAHSFQHVRKDIAKVRIEDDDLFQGLLRLKEYKEGTDRKI